MSLIIGTPNDEYLPGTSGDDTIQGLGGNDNLEGREGDDVLDGGDGQFDHAMYTAATSGVNVNLAAGGPQAVGGGQGTDTLIGIEGLNGSDHADTLTGDGGNNNLEGRGGDDLIDGAGGDDTANYWNATGSVTVDLQAGQASGPGVGTDTLVSIEGAAGGAYNDLLIGNGANNWLSGQGGDDTIHGGDGDNDNLQGDAGDDLLDGGAGRWDSAGYWGASSGVRVDLANGGPQAVGGGLGVDTLVGIESLYGSAHNDTLSGDDGENIIAGNEGNDLLDGRGGWDAIDFYSASGGVVVNLATGTSSGPHGSDSFVNFENVLGSWHSDTITGDAGDNYINPRDGDDWVDGGGGWDTLDYVEAGGGVSVDLATGLGVTPNGDDTISGIERVTGSNFNDTLSGDEANNSLGGRPGDDLIDGRGGTDGVEYYEAQGGVTVDLSVTTAQDVGGGEGFDTILNVEDVHGGGFGDLVFGDSQNNGLFGNGGNDTLLGGAGFDHFSGGTGDDSISGGSEDDHLEGAEGDDVLDGGDGVDAVTFWNAQDGVTVDLSIAGPQAMGGGLGTDTLHSIENAHGGGFGDTLSGDAGQNYLGGNGGDDSLAGRGGDDIVDGGVGNDTLDGGEGRDAVDYYGAANGVTVNLTGGFATGNGTDTLANFEMIFASFHSDHLTGNDGDNYVDARGGADTVNGLGGSDHLRGGDGNDQLLGGSGNDHLEGEGGDDVVDGQDGVDGAVYWSAGAGVTVDLAIAGPQAVGAGYGSDTLLNIEDLHGGGFGDTLSGNAANNALFGNGGDDSLSGRGGDDNLQGMWGNDTLDGGAGNDMASYWGASGGVSVSLAIVGPQAVGADQGVDSLSNFEALQGGAFNDSLTGNAGANLLLGGPGGSDLLSGLEGNDTLIGNDGADTLQGGAGFDNALGGIGDDLIDGGADDDFLRGEGGNDTLRGGDADDFMVGAGGADVFEGGAGFDRVSFFGTAPAVHVDLNVSGPQQTGAGMDTFVDVEHVSGTHGADTLVGDAEANWLWGSGGGSADWLTGNGGDDLLMVGAGDHVLAGGDGVDTVALPIPQDVGEGVAISLALQGAAQDTGRGFMTLSGIENLSGTVFADTLSGDAGANVLAGYEDADLLQGGDGNDTLLGDGAIDIWSVGGGSGAIHTYLDLNDFDGVNNGGDTLEGGAGDDVLRGGGEDDWLDGGEGEDRAVFSGAASDYDVETQADGSIVVTDLREGGPDGVDTIVGVEVLSFSDGDVAVGGPPPAEPLVIHGGNGKDHIVGDAGDDQLFGENGKDTLDGGAGDDLLTGGRGNDVFVFSGGDDVVADFDDKNDQVSVAGRFDSFAEVQAAAVQDGGDVVITDGADSIRLVGVSLSSLGSDDFLF